MATQTANINQAGVKSSKGPANDDLQTELQKVLSDSNFSFDGNFYHGSILSNPPNPCLTIEGLGLVGLPLGERDVKAIIATCSTSAPSRRGRGKGSRAKAKKEVRNTWEIEPSKITFGNTAWQKYLDTTLCSMLCKSLGVRSGTSQLKMELSKLLVYETGAQLLPHQETPNVNGVFATATILLPSAYTGGQVVVTHASTTETVDFAKNSMLSTALLAWYTDVKFEVKAIESGYRVALAYNLIQVPQENGAPLPCLPDMTNSTRELRRVLENWKNDQHGDNSPKFLAYLLKNAFSCTWGMESLDGVDLHKATYIRPVAEELGFRVYLAKLEHRISGCEDDEDDYHRDGHRQYHSYHDEDSDEDSEAENDAFHMAENHSTTTKISDMVEINGDQVAFGSSIDIESNWLIPKNPFLGKTPDDTDYEGCFGQLVYCYEGIALVLMNQDKADDFLYESEGASYAFHMLIKSRGVPPTASHRQWAERLLIAEKKDPSLSSESYIRILIEFALKSNDIGLWKSTASTPSCTLSLMNSNLPMNFMDIFSFEDMRPSFEALLKRSKSLTDKMDFLSKFAPKGSSDENDTLHAWYQQEVMKILSSCSSANVQDVPTLLSIIRLFGLQAFRNLVLPNLTKGVESYEFWMAFVKALWENRTTILEQESSVVPPMFANASSAGKGPSTHTLTAEAAIHSIAKQGLEFASTRWNYWGRKNYYYYNAYSSFNDRSNIIRIVDLDRVIEVVDQAIVLSELGICKSLFDDILTSEHFDTFKKTKDVFSPLLPRLRELLEERGLDLFQSPFVDFIRSFVGLYLQDVLGKGGKLSSAHMHKIGCSGSCDDCELLDNFVMDPTKKTTLLRAPKARRLHLEQQADDGKDLLTYEVIKSGSPHGLQLTKLPAVVDASTWPSRQKAAKIFLETIGSANDLSRIMGNRLVDVKHALEGVRGYDTALSSVIISTSATSQRTVATTVRGSAQSQTSRVANNPQGAPSTSNSTTAVPRKASATDFPQRSASKKRKI